MERSHNPERQSPEIEVELGEKAMLLTFYNTDVFLYGKSHEHMRHAYVQEYESSGAGAYVFNAGLTDRLIAEGFPYHYQQWPEAEDEEAYVSHNMSDLEQELDSLS